MGNSIYAVIDTNVIVSALISQKPQSYPLAVLSYVYSGKIVPVLNDEILAEYRNVLSRPKFKLDPVDIDTALHVITQYGLHLARTPICDEIFPDPQDIVFYEVKMSKEDTYLVTGNIKHFPRGPYVVTPREMVELIDKTMPAGA